MISCLEIKRKQTKHAKRIVLQDWLQQLIRNSNLFNFGQTFRFKVIIFLKIHFRYPVFTLVSLCYVFYVDWPFEVFLQKKFSVIFFVHEIIIARTQGIGSALTFNELQSRIVFDPLRGQRIFWRSWRPPKPDFFIRIIIFYRFWKT